MKKYKLIAVSMFLCFVFSIALFSNEGATASSKEDEQKSENQTLQPIIENTKEVATENPQNATTNNIQDDKKTEEGAIEIKEEIKQTDVKGDEKKESEKEDIPKEKATQKDGEREETLKKDVEKKEREKDEIPEAPDFSSIQVSGLSVGQGSRWYFEEYDENGNMIGAVSYDRRKLLSKSSIEYSEGKKVVATFTEPDMIVKVRYNNKGVEVGREEFTNKNGMIGKPLNSSAGVYDENEKLLEETKIENGVAVRHVYTYNGKEKTTETIYENGIKTLFIEYRQGKKTVHVFNEGVEVTVFDEEIE